MGLLSDVKSRKKLTDIFTLQYQKLILFSFIVGIVWFCLLASSILNDKTYFSENALLPGLVVREFNPRSALSQRLNSLIEEEEKGFPQAWIQSQFHQLGLDVYYNNFTVNYPFGSKPTYKNKNLYAILRAPKVSSTEAIVISTPYRNRDSIHENNYASIALMIELAQAFRLQNYWSKDIIFLITQFENIGFQAWLDAYHNVRTSNHITSENLHCTSGLIQGVINLEISSYHFSSMDIKIEGLHGQLPNLDFFNLLVELASREQISINFEELVNSYPTRSFSVQNWIRNFQTMTRMMAMQATGLPSGGHGLFHRFGIQAVTLKSLKIEKSNSANLIQLGRVVEGAVRSLNNLLEKFHQSYFFYLLPSTRSYISIGLYFLPFSLIVLPILIKALQMYLNCQSSYPLSSETNCWITCNLFVVHTFGGFLMLFIPMCIDYVKDFYNLSTENLLYHGILLIMLTWLIFTFCFLPKVSSRDFECMMCFVLLLMGGVIFSLALVNISLAVVFTLVYVPVSISLKCKGKLSFLQFLYLFLINPLTITYIFVVIQSYSLDSKTVWWNHFVRGFEGQKKMILYTIEDMYFFGNWNYKITVLVILPIWFNLLSLKILNMYLID